MQERLIKRAAIRKIGEPQDIANIVAFLASDRAKYITGWNILVDVALTFSFIKKR